MADTDPSTLLSPQELAAGMTRLVQHYQRIGVSLLPRGDAEAGRRALAGLRHGDAALPVAPGRAEDRDAGAAPAVPVATAPRGGSAAAAAPPSAATAQVAPPRGGDRSIAVGLPLDQRQQQLQQWAACVAACTRCETLASTRTQTVFGEGDPQARVCFFGEAPGADEDRQGRPFVGRAGQLLTKMIEACGMRREEVYILNTLKCRPPNNRNPEPDEVARCREYFEAQLQIVQPEYIVCLGLIAAQALLDSKLSVGRLRGRLHDYRNSKVVVTYHPAYLLRNPSAKRAAWDDLKLMLRDMGVAPASG